jgi:hypothetical protein
MVSKKNHFFTGKKACVRIFLKVTKRARFILLESFLDLYKNSLRFIAQFTLSTFTGCNFSRKINYTRARTSTFSAVFFFRIMQYICTVFVAAKAMILLVLILSSCPALAFARTSNMMPASGTHKVYLPQSNRPVATL